MPTPQIEALVKRVEQLGRKYPPPPTLEGPGFVMINPPKLNPWPEKLSRRERAETVLISILGGLTGTALGATVWLFVNL